MSAGKVISNMTFVKMTNILMKSTKYNLTI